LRRFSRPAVTSAVSSGGSSTTRPSDEPSAARSMRRIDAVAGVPGLAPGDPKTTRTAVPSWRPPRIVSSMALSPTANWPGSVVVGRPA
jgi:hypothetical protein